MISRLTRSKINYFAARSLGALFDIAIVASAYLFAFILRFDFKEPRWGWSAVALSFITVAAVHIGMFLVTGCNKLSWRRISVAHIPYYFAATFFSALILTALRFVLPVDSFSYIRPPYSITVMSFFFSTVGIVAARWFWQLYVRAKNSIPVLPNPDDKTFDNSLVARYFAGKEVMVTGAGGAVGSEVVSQLSQAGVSKLILVDRSEDALCKLASWLSPNVKRELVLCDVSNLTALERVFLQHKVNVVIHAAAYKHVHIVESNPAEGWKNNFEAVKAIAKLSEKYGACRFSLVSTVKAVNPSSVMGKTKLEAEKFLMELNKSSSTSFCAVRFGNLFGTVGSVIEIFKGKVSRKEPLLVTHPDMERYFMTPQEAVSLFLQAVTRDERVVYTLDMGKPLKILDLAEDIILKAGFRPYVDIPIEFVGVRPGEKIREEFDISEKSADKTDMAKIYITKLLASFVVMATTFIFADTGDKAQSPQEETSQENAEVESEAENSSSKPSFERYESILKRQMFGTPPVGFDPLLSPANVKASRRDGEKQALSPEQQNLQKSVKFTVLNLDSSGNVMVGFSDYTDAKLPKHFYMKVGDTFRGWKVLEADVLAGTAALEKDGIRLDMTLGEQAKAAQSAANQPPSTGRSMSERRLMRQRARENEERAEQARVEQARRDAQVAQERAERDAEDRAQSNMIILELGNELKKIRAEREASQATEGKSEKESSNVEH